MLVEDLKCNLDKGGMNEEDGLILVDKNGNERKHLANDGLNSISQSSSGALGLSICSARLAKHIRV